MIDPNKQYRTRDGREVRIYAVDAGGDRPVHGAIRDGGEWLSFVWTASGEIVSGYASGVRPTALHYDLIEVKLRIQREVWVNVYPKITSIHGSKDEADYASELHRIACLKITIDCEEGEGL